MAAQNPAGQSGPSHTPRKGSDATKGMQQMFIQRLRRLTWLRRSCSGQLDDAVLKSLDRAIYSTYCDCTELGVLDEARGLLKGEE